MNGFNLERMKETLSNRVIPAVALSAHAARESVSFQEGLKQIARILASTVKVTERFCYSATTSHGHVHGVTDQPRRHALVERPPDNLTTEEIEDNSQIQPAFFRPDVGDIAVSDHRPPSFFLYVSYIRSS